MDACQISYKIVLSIFVKINYATKSYLHYAPCQLLIGI